MCNQILIPTHNFTELNISDTLGCKLNSMLYEYVKFIHRRNDIKIVECLNKHKLVDTLSNSIIFTSV